MNRPGVPLKIPECFVPATVQDADVLQAVPDEMSLSETVENLMQRVLEGPQMDVPISPNFRAELELMTAGFIFDTLPPGRDELMFTSESSSEITGSNLDSTAVFFPELYPPSYHTGSALIMGSLSSAGRDGTSFAPSQTQQRRKAQECKGTQQHARNSGCTNAIT